MPSARTNTDKKSKTGEPVPDRSNDRVLRLSDICEKLGVRRCTVYRRRKRDPRFPPPANATLYGGDVWESDFNAYLDLIQREPHPPAQK